MELNPLLEPIAPFPVMASLRRADIPAVKGLIADVVLEFYADLDFLPKTRSGLLAHYDAVGYLQDIDAFETEYAEANGLFLVLQDASGVIGCGGLRRISADQGELVRLWLRKEARGRGYGGMLVREILVASDRIGYREVLLDTSKRCVAAISLFRKSGFHEVPKYKESIGDVFMGKKSPKRGLA
ncbi:MAG: GNAT family N-acetyltransferase [Fibrobacteria bacterium]